MFERYAAIGYFGSIPFVQGGFILEFCPDWSDYVGVSDVGVRVSASNGIVLNAMDKEALVQEILDERARELAFEGHRWFDLRRSTRPRLEKVLDGTRYVLEENDARYTLAIPKEAIEANPGLLN